jgi:flagellar protein FlbD
MIKLTRLNDRPFVINAEQILYLEETPDTVVTLMTQDKVVVKESVDDVIQRVLEYRRSIRLIPSND